MTPALTAAQLTALKNDIAASPDVSGIPHTADGAFAVAKIYNLPASPTYTAWKTSVPIVQVGDNFNGAELAGLTSANQTRLQTIALYSESGVNPSLTDRRAFFDDIFSGAGGTTTRANLLALWKRLATRAEKLYATGTGSNASPGTMGPEGPLTTNEVQNAWDS